MPENFNTWFATFKKSINSFKYYTDFDKVYENANKFKIEINILNSLIGSQNLEKDFKNLISKYPECLKAIPILLAVRANEIYCQDEYKAIRYQFLDKLTQTPDEYVYFMKETGLFDAISNHIINNLFDYVTGIEVGLDTNTRKNRGGNQMEDLVEHYIESAGFIKDKTYFKEKQLTDIKRKLDINLNFDFTDRISRKRWDFVIKTNEIIYVVETNFYATVGTKQIETAGSYQSIAKEIETLNNVEFIWITDGQKGWKRSLGELENSAKQIKHLYNIKDMEDGLFNKLYTNSHLQ